jgi:putative spermidine/putrescine transport system ATP-binding protein
MDEPLGALDKQLREQMQLEIKHIHESLGVTVVYVTHDQGEALAMSDRLAVFNHGRIEQIGSPRAIYEHPATVFVAGFVGVSNLLEGALAMRITGDAASFAIRPEKIRIAAPDDAVPDDCHAATGSIAGATYQGANTRYAVALDGGGALTVTTQNLDADGEDAAGAIGRVVRLIWRKSHIQPVGRVEDGS